MRESYVLQLMYAPGIGDAAMRKILHRAAGTGPTLEELCEHPQALSEIIPLRQNTVRGVMENQGRCGEIASELARQGIRMITELDSDYPQQLSQPLGSACPPVLFVRGNPDLLRAPSVGFTGSRNVSVKGVSIAADCARQLVQRGITVVSGYAEGSDLAAHTSALKNGGSTVFVLPEGILSYAVKSGVKDLLTAENHTFVSQFPPTEPWSAACARRRNSVIIGLSSAMILVESRNSGGTYATGEETLRRKMPLFVIDFEKPAPTAEANPYFIAKGGHPIRGRNGVPVLDRVFEALSQPRRDPSEFSQLTMGET